MNHYTQAALGIAGGVCSYLFGGWDAALQALLVFMVTDYLTGLAVAGLFRHSAKTKTGGLSSTICFRGIVKKCMMLVFVLIAHQLDLVIGATYIRDGVCAAFLSGELLSIIENAGMMGIPIPGVLADAIDLLKRKGD